MIHVDKKQWRCHIINMVFKQKHREDYKNFRINVEVKNALDPFDNTYYLCILGSATPPFMDYKWDSDKDKINMPYIKLDVNTDDEDIINEMINLQDKIKKEILKKFIQKIGTDE